MFSIFRRPSWYLPESAATPESLYRNRREFLRDLGLGGLMAAGIGCGIGGSTPLTEAAQDDGGQADKGGEAGEGGSSLPLPEFERNPKYADAGREITKKKYPLVFNNFYEFGFAKSDPAKNAKGFSLEPYTLEIDGLVDKPVKLDLEQIEKLGYEERVYRFRCVEAWAMTVPWLGVPLSKVLEQAGVKSEAKYVSFTSFYDPEVAPGQRKMHYEWPYFEGLRVDEAMNELAFVVTGLYGERLRPQSGTPLRIILPWKYGYKGPKSVVKMTLVKEQPKTFWNEAAPSEYKFYSNVDPEVPHPRWSQASEKLLGDVIKRVPTQWYNGYEEQVAHLYKDMPRKLY